MPLIKLGDIKGEFARKEILHPDFRPEASSQDVGSWTLQDNTFRGPKTDEVGWDVGPVGDAAENFAGAYSNSLGGFQADALNNDGANRFTTGGGGDSLTDAGLGTNSFHQGADVWTNGSATSINDAPPVFKTRSNWDVICDVGTSINQDGIDLQSDALVQQVNDFAGLISPDQMRPAEYFSHNPEWFAPGSAVDSWTEKTFGNGDGEILGGISQGNVFAPINVLRNGYDCEGAGAC